MEHPRENEMFGVQRHLLYASNAAPVTQWEEEKAAAAGKKAAKRRGSLTPNRTLTRRLTRPPSKLSLNPSLRLSRPLNARPKLPLRPPPWVPQRNHPANPQPHHVPKPIPRPWMGAKRRPRPPFGRTR